jgi:hypothetical protein
MDAREDGRAEDLRVAEIRAEIEVVRLRIAETFDALGYKADVPARLGDVMNSTAATVMARVLQHVPTIPRKAPDPDEMLDVADRSGETHEHISP